MGILNKVIGTATAAGAGAAATVVAQKVKENNPDGIKDVNNDGVINYADYLVEVQKAAKELFEDNAPAIKEAAQKKIDDIKASNPSANAVIDGIVDKIKDTIKK